MRIINTFLLATGIFAAAAAAPAVATAPAQVAPAPQATAELPPSQDPAVATEAPAAEAAAAGEPAVEGAAETEAAAADQALPVEGIGLPDGRYWLQDQVTDVGAQAAWFHNWILFPIITAISLLVLGLLLWVIVRYNRRANPEPSKTTHNTTLEVIWTLVPVLILVFIAVPSISLLARQYDLPEGETVTIKVTGNQWYWTYEYPDPGGIMLISHMLEEEGDQQEGARFRTDADGPRLLAVDERLVIPAGVNVRFLVTASDVIHSFAVPAFWTKIDAVPGRLNEGWVNVERPGVYFGQCSELCGARHAFMPIAVEVVPPAEFARWVRAQGGTMPGDTPADAGEDTETPVEEEGAPVPADEEVVAGTQQAAASADPAVVN